MITKKLMHDIQSWLNSLYDFKHKNNYKNKHIISSIENFGFRFIDVSVRIWSLRADGSLYSVCKSYSAKIRDNKDFIEFKDKVNSTVDDYINHSIDTTINNELDSFENM